MKDWHIGQLVVCVDLGYPDFKWKKESILKVGQIYTIRGIREYFEHLGLYLEEVIAPIDSSGKEMAIWDELFRPCKETNIDVFKSILVNPPKVLEDA